MSSAKQRSFLKGAHVTMQVSDTRVVREMYFFNFKRGLKFGIFRNGYPMYLGSWWAIRVRLDKDNDLIDYRFWRNCTEPGDTCLTGKKLQQAVQNWMEFRS